MTVDRTATTEPLTGRAELLRLLGDDPQVKPRRSKLKVVDRIRDNLHPPFILVEHGSIVEDAMTVSVRLYAGTADASSKYPETIDRLLPAIVRVIEQDSRGYVTGGNPFADGQWVGYELEVGDTRRLI